MPRYKNLAGTSGVAAYECAPGAIVVQFVDGDAYVYTDQSTGRATIELMQTLARRGRGLSTFISRHVRERYAEKVKIGAGTASTASVRPVASARSTASARRRPSAP